MEKRFLFTILRYAASSGKIEYVGSDVNIRFGKVLPTGTGIFGKVFIRTLAKNDGWVSNTIYKQRGSGSNIPDIHYALLPHQDIPFPTVCIQSPPLRNLPQGPLHEFQQRIIKCPKRLSQL
ncbi:MAG: hypothetical protein JW863_21915 [Chitinispirillaceae bacterium]|nr:hypothetical protein [Chitinispirillaceae bacterium]